MTPDEQRISDAATGDWRYRAMRTEIEHLTKELRAAESQIEGKAQTIERLIAKIERLKAALVEICDPTLSPFEMRAVAAGALEWGGPSRSSTL